MTDRIKDPLGVVQKWREQADRYHFTGWDDTKYGVGGLLLVLGLVASPILLIVALIF